MKAFNALSTCLSGGRVGKTTQFFPGRTPFLFVITHFHVRKIASR
jgi:hypothetical protein